MITKNRDNNTFIEDIQTYFRWNRKKINASQAQLVIDELIIAENEGKSVLNTLDRLVTKVKTPKTEMVYKKRAKRVRKKSEHKTKIHRMKITNKDGEFHFETKKEVYKWLVERYGYTYDSCRSLIRNSIKSGKINKRGWKIENK